MKALHTEKWFLSLSEKNGDQHMELMLSENSGCSDEEGNNDYMRISGFCSHDKAKLMKAAPELLKALESICDLPEYRNGMSMVWNEGFRSGVMQAIYLAKSAIKSATE